MGHLPLVGMFLEQLIRSSSLLARPCEELGLGLGNLTHCHHSDNLASCCTLACKSPRTTFMQVWEFRTCSMFDCSLWSQHGLIPSAGRVLASSSLESVLCLSRLTESLTYGWNWVYEACEEKPMLYLILLTYVHKPVGPPWWDCCSSESVLPHHTSSAFSVSFAHPMPDSNQ